MNWSINTPLELQRPCHTIINYCEKFISKYPLRMEISDLVRTNDWYFSIIVNYYAIKIHYDF